MRTFLATCVANFFSSEVPPARGTMPWLSQAAEAVAALLPHVHRRTLTGQPHNVADEAMAPTLIEFFHD